MKIFDHQSQLLLALDADSQHEAARHEEREALAILK